MTDTSIDDGQLYIGGKFAQGSSGRRFDVTDPSTGAVVGTVADADPADIDTAVAAARLAFDEGPWPRMSGRERARILHKAADLIRARAEEIVRLESLDVGKPVSLCLPVDVLTTAEVYEYYSALAQSVDGATREIPINAHAYTRREPLGVVAAITPFNFPLILSTSKRHEGGRIISGGERLELGGGFYYQPTVIAGLANDSRVVQEEVFGPVLTVQPFDSEDEAVALANSTRYGLAAGVQTTDLARAHRVAAGLQAGIVWVNDWAMLDPAIPFGGVKDSGFGREYGPEALQSYTSFPGHRFAA
jgi:acyl-CoA reductase-like NAD-dependent aldehyde dehydrogenase